MSASPVDIKRDACIRIAFRYLLITILCAVFGAVYEAFSHGVYSFAMLYAFGIPMLGGLLPALMFLRHGLDLPSASAMQLWHFGISALTVGSLFAGALEIYGTSSNLTVVYWLAGGTCLLLAALVAFFVPAKGSQKADAHPGL